MRWARMSSTRPPSMRLSLRRMIGAAALVMIILAALAGGSQWERLRARRFEHARGKSLPGGSTTRHSAPAGAHPARPAKHTPFDARSIEEKYHLHVAWKDEVYPVKTHHGPISATNALPADLDDYYALLAQEFMLYPPRLITLCKLKRIVLCRDLAYNAQKRAAVPDFEHDTLYLDVLRGGSNRSYQRLVIHHEFFHLIDYKDDGALYSDAEWARLNGEKFRYGRGGVTMQNDGSSGLLSNIPGFLTRYGTSGVEEDKAELFGHMMTEYPTVEKRAANDRVIHDKMSHMKALMAKFCSDMDETFWDQVNRR
jgi:hypothetical protein